MTKKIFLIFLVLFIISFVNSIENWRQFRHDWYRTASTTEELRNNASWGDDASFNFIWSHEFREWPHGNANLCMVDNALYLSLMDGTIRKIDADASSYTELWVVNTGASVPTTPCVYDNKVIVVNIRGRIMALKVSDGSVIWEYQLPTDVYAPPLYVNGRVYIGGIDGILYCFDAENGGSGPLWSYETIYGSIDSAPCYHNGKIIFASENMHAYALNWKNGTVVWDIILRSGDKTWNGSPVVARDANKVVFQTMSTYIPDYNWGSTYRDVCDSCAGFYDVGGCTHDDLTCLVDNDTYFNNGVPWVGTNIVLDTETGQEMRNFSYSGTQISVLPFTSMYWNSIRWCVYNHSRLYAEGFRRQWLVDLTNGQITRLNSYNYTYPYTDAWCNNSRNRNCYSAYYVRGDENVLPVISGNRVIGGIRKNLAALDLTNGNRIQLKGDYMTEGSDATHIMARTYSDPHYFTHPGDGYTGENSELMPYHNNRVYYIDNGWLHCMVPIRNGSVTDINTDLTAPSVPAGLSASDLGGGKVSITWNPSNDNVKTTSYRVYRDGLWIATCVDTEYIDTGLQGGVQVNYQVSALDWPENESAKSTTLSFTPGGGTGDTTPPANITNLSIVSVSSFSVTLSWTAPGDDGNTGTAAIYDIRYSVTQITGESTFSTALQATGEPQPLQAGTNQIWTVAGLTSGTTYYFAMKTADEAGNWSGISNVVSGVTQSGPAGPSITVLSPNGGEQWTAGSVRTVLWTSQGTVGPVNIDISTNGGSNWTNLVSNTQNDGSQTVTVPSTLSTSCLVRVAETDGTPSDISDANFSIVTQQAVPVLRVDKTSLDFGEVEFGRTQTLEFSITNAGSGSLTGSISCSDEWVIVVPENFTAPAVINVTVDNEILGMKEGVYTSTITINSNGGSAQIILELTATCVLVKPNPVKAGESLTFFGSGIVPNKTEIKIYTIYGEMIKEINNISGKEIEWDGKDERGNTILPGIYIYIYQSPTEKGVGKFTVRR